VALRPLGGGNDFNQQLQRTLGEGILVLITRLPKLRGNREKRNLYIFCLLIEMKRNCWSIELLRQSLDRLLFQFQPLLIGSCAKRDSQPFVNQSNHRQWLSKVMSCRTERRRLEVDRALQIQLVTNSYRRMLGRADFRSVRLVGTERFCVAITCGRFSSRYFGWKGHRILRGVS
jgi:hypothetical protein